MDTEHVEAAATDEVAGTQTEDGQEQQPAEVVTEPAGTQAETQADDQEHLLGEGEIKGITPEAQEKINRRIGKVVGKQKAAEERATAAETELAGLRTKLGELEQTRDVTLAAEAVRLGVHPDYLKAEEVTQLKEYDELLGTEAWLLENPEGDGEKWTPEKVRKEQARVVQRLRAIGPRMEGLKAERFAQMQADLRLGRAAREAKWSPEAAKKAAAPATPQKIPVPPAASAQRTPTKGAAVPAKPSFSGQSVMDKGGGRRGLASVYEQIA